MSVASEPTVLAFCPLPPGASQVPQSFWGHLPDEGIAQNSLSFWDMTWRSSGPFKAGREKLILNMSNVGYISVHQVTTGRCCKPRPTFSSMGTPAHHSGCDRNSLSGHVISASVSLRRWVERD